METTYWTCPVCASRNTAEIPACGGCGFQQADCEVLLRTRSREAMDEFGAQEWFAAGMMIRDLRRKYAYYKFGMELGDPTYYSLALRGVRQVLDARDSDGGELFIFKRRIAVPAHNGPHSAPKSDAAPGGTRKGPPPAAGTFAYAKPPDHGSRWTCPLCFTQNANASPKCHACGFFAKDRGVLPATWEEVADLGKSDAERWYMAGTKVRDLEWRMIFFQEGLQSGHRDYYSKALRAVRETREALRARPQPLPPKQGSRPAGPRARPSTTYTRPYPKKPSYSQPTSTTRIATPSRPRNTSLEESHQLWRVGVLVGAIFFVLGVACLVASTSMRVPSNATILLVVGIGNLCLGFALAAAAGSHRPR